MRMKLTLAPLLPLALPLVLALSAAACAGPVPPAKEPYTSATPAFTLPSLAAGETDCGVFDIEQGQGLPETAMRCVIDAAAQGRSARLQEKRPTIEGEPIFSVYRVKATGAVEVTRDTTHDSYGNQGIVTETCTGPYASHGILMFAKCAP